MTEQERQEFLAERRVAVLAVASDSGRPPLTVPVWYAYQPGGDLTFFTGTQGSKTRKTRLIAEAGVLSLNVQNPELPYKFVTIEGTVTGTNREPTFDQLFAVVSRYLPEEMARGFVEAELARPASESELVLYTVRPDRWISLDFSE
jgi:nitroimidazol reductase NimA-like FMN-containing flavoprotein (pyridoxamine 5'-phosphate oxidase superfamily)